MMTKELLSISISLREIRILLILFLFLSSITTQADTNNPNDHIIVGGDISVDIINGNNNNSVMPFTPEIDALRVPEVNYRNAWIILTDTPISFITMSRHNYVRIG